MVRGRKHPPLLLLALLLALIVLLAWPASLMAQTADPEPVPPAQEAPVPQRTQEEIDQRRAEIETPLAERRPAPTDEFPWEPLTIGLGAGVLVIGLVLVWRLSGYMPASAQQLTASGAPHGVWSGWRPHDGDTQP